MKPRSAASHVMVGWILIMPPACGGHGQKLASVPAAPPSEWTVMGGFNSSENCENKRHALWLEEKNQPVRQHASLKSLADAEMQAICVKSADSRLKSASWGPPFPNRNDQSAATGEVAQAEKQTPHQKHVRAPNWFPGPPNEIESPNARYVLKNVDHPEEMETAEDWHSIFLIDRKTGEERLFYKYGRGVDIVWSPFSDAVVVNDGWASNESRVVLFLLSPIRRRIDVGKQLLKSNRPAQEKRSFRSAVHAYPHVFKWLDTDTLLLKIYGYNGVDPDGFTLVYEYNVRKNSFALKEYLHQLKDD